MALALTASPAVVLPTGTVTATWSGNTGATNGDWIGWYHPGDSDLAGGTGGPGTEWVYTNTTATSGSMTIPTPPTAGTYELRMFSNGGYTKLGVSNQFRVSALLSDQPPDPTPSGLVEEPSEGTQQAN